MPLLRTARASDASRLSEFAEAVFRDTFSEVNTAENMDAYCGDTFSPVLQAAELQDPDREAFLAETDGELVGFVQLRWNVGLDGVYATSSVQLHRLYVARPWHGAGVAQQLMDATFGAARTRDVRHIWLGVWEHNPRAIAFYAKFGFSMVGEVVFPLGSELQRDVILASAVEPT